MDEVFYLFWKGIFIIGAVGACITFFLGSGKKASVEHALRLLVTGFLPYKAFCYLVGNHWFGPGVSSIISFIILINVFFISLIVFGVLFKISAKEKNGAQG